MDVCANLDGGGLTASGNMPEPPAKQAQRMLERAPSIRFCCTTPLHGGESSLSGTFANVLNAVGTADTANHRTLGQSMTDQFFEQPILNSPYEYPAHHWELDKTGQPTNRIIDSRRRAEFITPIPKPKKRKQATAQQEIVFDEGMGLSSAEQQYDTMSIVNEVRRRVDAWRELRDPSQWHVTPETARLLQHWRHHRFSSFRPFFCQIEAVENRYLADRSHAEAWQGYTAHPRPPHGSQRPDRLRSTPTRFEARNRRRQDNRHGHDHRVADHQCCTSTEQQEIHPRVSRCHSGFDDQRPSPRPAVQ